MKKQTKIVLGGVIAVIVVIFAISFFFPSVFEGITSGTFGKVDRFRKSQMTEKDIKLRSEYTSDTVQLKKMISGLVYFTAFTNDLSNKIDSSVSIFEKNGFDSKINTYKNLMLVKDYSDFIKNNNKTLETTILMLNGFYENKSDESVDVEKNLREFGNYVKNLNERDSVLEVALKSMDNFMLSNKLLKGKKAELIQLKSIRDRLLTAGIQTAGLLRDQSAVSSLVVMAVGSQESFQRVFGNMGDLKFATCSQAQVAAFSQQKLDRVLSTGEIGFVSSNQAVSVDATKTNNAVNSQSKDLNVVYYDAKNLSYVVGNMSDLKVVILTGSAVASSAVASQQGIGAVLTGIIVPCATGGFNLVEPNLNIANLLYSQPVQSVFHNISMGKHELAQEQLGSVSYGSVFVGMVDNLANQGIGVQSDR